ncbi:hypothetical protein SLE2022_212800 [Rubroshorea leprosula]
MYKQRSNKNMKLDENVNRKKREQTREDEDEDDNEQRRNAVDGEDGGVGKDSCHKCRQLQISEHVLMLQPRSRSKATLSCAVLCCETVTLKSLQNSFLL